MAIAQGVIKRTGELISSSVTNASTLVAGFLRRCAEAGVFFVEKHGLELGMLRSINQNRAAPAAYAAQHGLHGALTLDVGIWDEAGLDLCSFAEVSTFHYLQHFGNQVHDCNPGGASSTTAASARDDERSDVSRSLVVAAV